MRMRVQLYGKNYKLDQSTKAPYNISIMASIRNSNTILFLMFILFIQLDTHSAKHTKQDSRCVESERKALMEFKGSLIDHENRLSSWRGRDCCSWLGITCHNLTGFVQTLNLSDVYLGGEINPSLVNLEHLEYLDFSYTHGFFGLPIPAFLGSFRNLQLLNLQDAGFRGEIPQQLGNLSNLQHLTLGDGDELSSKSLDWITGLSSLKSLQLSIVDLSESVDWLESVNMLSSLSSLTLTHCGLTMSTNSHYHVNNLTSLVSLDLSYNHHLNFDTLPSWLFNLTHLQHLSFSNTTLQDLSHLAKMTTLTRLELSHNPLSCSFPDSVCNLTALNFLSLNYSDIQGPLPVCLGNLTSLTSLYLGRNKLSGKIPGELKYLTQLTVLDLGENELSGEIPNELGYLTKLTHLDLSHNRLSGTVPSTWGKLTKLQLLDVADNSLMGELSESFFNGLQSLTELYLSKNKCLVLNVSSQWTPPFQIHSLFMDDVFIGTQFPSWLQTQTNLQSLTLSNASISSDIPDWCLTAYPSLYYFDLSSNFLNGSIPTFENAPLQYLILSNNNISGNIPQELCNLSYLTILSLASNQLTGRIPLCLGNLLGLNALYLANNDLYGHIPNELGYLKYLRILHLNGNKFFGKLPSSLQNLTNLETLDLGNNELNGVIPAWIGKELSNLQYLRLQSNHFSSQITVNLCQLQALQILNLAQNNLVGTIPPCLANLSKMLSTESGRRGNFINNVDTAIYTDRLLNIVKGNELEYTSNLQYAKFISLSSNHLHGEIPDELMDLKGLQSLNLSNNHLSGRIPRKIGNLKNLESLDLSMNQIARTIPQSLADIDALSYLNLSFNNLTGRIPSGSHFDTLYNSSIYEGNSGLCGKLLMKNCPGDLVTSNKQNGPVSDGDNNEFEFSWFYGGMGTGFAIGFLGVMCILYFNKPWRNEYFDFLENVYNRVCVAFAIKISQFERKFN